MCVNRWPLEAESVVFAKPSNVLLRFVKPFSFCERLTGRPTTQGDLISQVCGNSLDLTYEQHRLAAGHICDVGALAAPVTDRRLVRQKDWVSHIYFRRTRRRAHVVGPRPNQSTGYVSHETAA